MRRKQVVLSAGFGVTSLILAGFSQRASAQQWVAQGPGPTTGGQVAGLTSQSNPVSGAVKAVVASPSDANVMYVGAVNGGIWKTTNATSASPTWTPETDFQTSLSIGALQFDPTDATNSTLIAGIGRYSSDANNGGAFTGLLRTTNGGSNWSSITSLAGKEISGVAARGNTIIASVDFANSFTYGNIGIYRSTNGGASFTQVSSGNPNSGGTSGLFGGRAFDLAADPTNTSVLYTAIRDAGTNDGVYRSADSGATWSRVSDSTVNALFSDSSSGTVNVKMTVGNSGQVFVGIENNGKLAGLFRSATGQGSWTALDVPSTNEGGTTVGINPDEAGQTTVADIGDSTPGGQGVIHFSITADPNNANTVYVGGDRQPSPNGDTAGFNGANSNSVGATNYTGRLFRVDGSLAAGSQATAITDNFTSGHTGPHADSRRLTFDASGNLIESDDGGVYKRSSPTSSTGNWSSLIGNLAVAETHSVAYDHNSHTIIGGAQDTGVTEQVTAGGTTWREVSQGDGGDVAVDNTTPGTGVRYSSAQFLQAFERRTVNASNTVTGASFPALTVNGSGGKSISAYDTSVQFYTPVATNKVNGNLYIGTNHIYESTDGGSTLTDLANLGAAVNGIAAGGKQNGVSNPSALYVAAGSSVFVRTTNGAAPAAAPGYSGGTALGVAMSDIDWANAFVVDPSHVYETTNSGSTFSNITGSLLENLHTIDYATIGGTGVVLVGGDDGVFYSTTGALGTWTELGAATLPNAPVYDLHYDAADDVLVAGTLGRGAFTFPNFSATFVPEPATFGTIATAAAATLLRRRRRA